MTPAIALITDFGTQDAYVGVMKGAIASLCPTAPTIDITHQLPPQDVYAARFTLLCSYPYLPVGTIYLVVVDPGVGTSRRAIAVQTRRGTLVGPDNGVLSAVLEPGLDTANRAVELTNAAYWRVPQPSTTFHGRDIFAPVAAHLASGTPLECLRPALELASLVRLPVAVAIATATGWRGTVQYIDRFGNAATTIAAPAVAAGQWRLRVGESTVPLAHTYGDVAPGAGLAVVGSHGFVELAVNRGSAQERFGLALGDVVTLEVIP